MFELTQLLPELVTRGLLWSKPSAISSKIFADQKQFQQYVLRGLDRIKVVCAYSLPPIFSRVGETGLKLFDKNF
jgi:hypothetical protein